MNAIDSMGVSNSWAKDHNNGPIGRNKEKMANSGERSGLSLVGV
jgi:hypothetical protein